MIQDRLNDKEHDIRGVQKQSSELLSIAWQKGYQAGFDDGYATRREAEIAPQGDLADEVLKLYEKYHSHLATHVIEFGDELKDLLGKYQKGGAN